MMTRSEYHDKFLVGYYTAVGGFYMVTSHSLDLEDAKKTAEMLYDKYKESGYTMTLLKLRGITCVQVMKNDEVLVQYGSC